MTCVSALAASLWVAVVLAPWWCVPSARAADESAPAAGMPSASPQADSETGPVLPWNRSADDDIQPPTPRLSSPREMLDLFSIDASQIRQLEDGVPLAIGEEETLFKILYRLPFFGLDKMEAWRRSEADWTALAEHPEEGRLEVFPVQGRVTQVQRLEVPPETAARLEFDRYFQVRLQLAGTSRTALICCRDVPRAWESADAWDEPARCDGLFLKIGGDQGGQAELVFAAQRVAWLPQQADPRWGLTPDMVYLASLGMDAGLFDVVRNTNRRAITAEDRECFYQLLAAMGRAAPAEVFGRAELSPDLTPLLTQPETQHGRIVSLLGTAKRVQRIAIDEPDVRQRFGIDHYYQIDLFVSLGDTEIRFESKHGQEAAVFRHNYPVTCCVLELPPGLPPRDDIAVAVRFAGAYFKLWAYKSEYVAALDDRQRQVSPLFIATTPRVVVFDHSTSQLVGWIGGIAVVLLLLAVGYYTWVPRPSDKRMEQEVLRPRLELGASQSLNDFDFPTQDRPDFSGLADRDLNAGERKPEQ